MPDREIRKKTLKRENSENGEARDSSHTSSSIIEWRIKGTIRPRQFKDISKELRTKKKGEAVPGGKDCS